MADRLNISVEDRIKYDKIKNEINFLSDKDAKDLFLFAFLYGVRFNKKKELTRKEGFIRTEYLKDEDITIMKAVALYYESMDILNNEERVFELAERFAHAGIDLLINEIENIRYGSFEKKFEVEINKILSTTSVSQ